MHGPKKREILTWNQASNPKPYTQDSHHVDGQKQTRAYWVLRTRGPRKWKDIPDSWRLEGRGLLTVTRGVSGDYSVFRSFERLANSSLIRIYATRHDRSGAAHMKLKEGSTALEGSGPLPGRRPTPCALRWPGPRPSWPWRGDRGVGFICV